MVLRSLHEQATIANDRIDGSAPKQYCSQIMEHFQLESPHQGPYVADTITAQRRTAIVASKLDRILRSLEALDERDDASALSLDAKN